MQAVPPTVEVEIDVREDGTRLRVGTEGMTREEAREMALAAKDALEEVAVAAGLDPADVMQAVTMQVKCDANCGAVAPEGTAGWLTIGNFDFCPKCQAEGKVHA